MTEGVVEEEEEEEDEEEALDKECQEELPGAVDLPEPQEEQVPTPAPQTPQRVPTA